ncbi:MAG: hypothetical protein K0Q67_2071, partial [Cellvibrio sp.]|nr:hypothetical protein [Cellvibrio sp.]
MLFASSGERILQPNPPRLAQLLTVFLAYSLTGWLGLCIPFENDKITLFWLPSGIAVAALYRWSPQLWPGVFLAALALNLLSGANLSTTFLLASGNTLGPMFTVWLLRRAQCNLSHLHRANTLCFLLLGSLGMLVPAAMGGVVSSLYYNDNMESAFYTSLTRWMGDSLGVFLAAPLLTILNQT